MSSIHGLARVLSKLGFCSRAQGFRLILEGRVRLNGVVCRNPEQRADPKRDGIRVDGQLVGEARKVYLMLNKPRGLVTTARDERGRPTVFECFGKADLPSHLSPVGRLDQASEGLLLFTNDSEWAAHLMDPAARVEKTYHLQVNRIMDLASCEPLLLGIQEGGDTLKVARAAVLRTGERNSWLEVVLDEGKNRHLRRLCAALGLEVMRLVRVRIGGLELGSLAKGSFRVLSAAEVGALRSAGRGIG